MGKETKDEAKMSRGWGGPEVCTQMYNGHLDREHGVEAGDSHGRSVHRTVQSQRATPEIQEKKTVLEHIVTTGSQIRDTLGARRKQTCCGRVLIPDTLQ